MNVRNSPTSYICTVSNQQDTHQAHDSFLPHVLIGICCDYWDICVYFQR